MAVSVSQSYYGSAFVRARRASCSSLEYEKVCYSFILHKHKHKNISTHSSDELICD